jgi:hypothetical protein
MSFSSCDISSSIVAIALAAPGSSMLGGDGKRVNRMGKESG